MKPLIHALALAALLLATPLAFAQQPSQAQVDRLLEVMRAKETLDAILPQVQASQQQMVAQMVASGSIDESERARVESAIATTNQRITQALSWENLEPVYRDIYASTFTAEDVDAMVEFYSSPTGQNLLDKMPQLMQNTMTAVQQLVVPMLQQLEQDLQAIGEGD